MDFTGKTQFSILFWDEPIKKEYSNLSSFEMDYV